MGRRSETTIAIAFLLGVGLAAGLGCAGVMLAPSARFAFFERPDPGDPWSAKIIGWQRRERADAGAPIGLPPVAESGDRPLAPLAAAVVDRKVPAPGAAMVAAGAAPGDGLRAKYVAFRAERKRAVARDFAAWVQAQAKEHYVADGPIDHWATLEETLRADGDDCDGLELLTFHALRDLGFGDHEVFRAIVYRPSDGQHHMVTLWFEDADDPWVIDPTGAMTHGMPRMSEMPAWVPLKLFTDTVEYTVRPGAARGALASNP